MTPVDLVVFTLISATLLPVSVAVFALALADSLPVGRVVVAMACLLARALAAGAPVRFSPPSLPFRPPAALSCRAIARVQYP
jgi:hypothetical protein